jgi:hypothetical protein
LTEKNHLNHLEWEKRTHLVIKKTFEKGDKKRYQKRFKDNLCVFQAFCFDFLGTFGFWICVFWEQCEKYLTRVRKNIYPRCETITKNT